jgi:predicted GIY-YIG superfamily endonuclease
MVFYVYMIRSGSKVYVGATTDTKRRLRQHNGKLSGGSSYTRGTGDWRYEAIVSGFRTWREALQFEWALKHCIRKARGARGKTQALQSLIAQDRWTVNSPPASEVPLTLELTSKTQASRKPTQPTCFSCPYESPLPSPAPSREAPHFSCGPWSPSASPQSPHRPFQSQPRDGES